MELQKNKNHLENEKQNLLILASQLIDPLELKKEQYQGRPSIDIRTIIKCLLMMSYHGWSYRRANSDIEKMYEEGMIDCVPRRATLNKYMLDPEINKILEELIQVSALSFCDVEDCILMDATLFCSCLRISAGNIRKMDQRNITLPSVYKTRKLHICIGRRTKIIIVALCSPGQKHESRYFKELVKKVIARGFPIKTLIADCGYNSKEHYAFCDNLGIKSYIDFRKNQTGRRCKSKLYREQFNLYKYDHKKWKQTYSARVLIEAVFSAIKRKNTYYIRSRKDTSKDSELLLKCLWYNLNILAKHYIDS